MKNLIRLALAALAVTLLAPSARAAAPEKPAAATAASDAVVTIPVSGMTCGGCVDKVTGKLQAVTGVKKVDVNLEKRRARITFDAGKVTPKALAGVIKDAGYEPGVPALD